MNKVKLGDLVEFQRGYDLPKNKIQSGKYPVITSNGILGYHNEYKSGPSVVIGRSGTTGNPQLINKKFWAHNTTLFIKDFKGNDIKYIYYLLLNTDINKMKSGSNIPTLNRNHLHPISINATTDKILQRRIANTLSNIDNKIELNNKINDEFEAMAKTLYDYWFLQFEFPNEEGKPYKSSGGKMVWNEELKREIPEGWEVIALKNNIQIIKGISYTSKNINAYEGIPMINLASINIKREYNPNQLKYFRGSYNINKEVSAFDMLIACTDLTRNAEIIGSPILVPNDNKKYIYSMDLAKIEVINSKIIPLYLYMTLRTDFFHKYIKGFASGTNVLHLDTRGIEYYKIYIPDKKLQKKFADILHNIHCKQSNIMKENQELTSLRDFLLPLLMNGQVGFKEDKAEG